MIAKSVTARAKQNIGRFAIPWSEKQHRLFEAAAHDPRIAQQKGIPQQKAAQMASEGIKSPSKPQRLAKMLGSMK